MKYAIIFTLVISIMAVVGIFFTFSKPETVQYQIIKIEKMGSYDVINALYTGASLEFKKIEEVMKIIRSKCDKPCKINLYSTRETYELDILPGQPSFNGYNDAQKNYLSNHILAFWGMGKSDSVEYYPAK
jgi:hypothetical protein